MPQGITVAEYLSRQIEASGKSQMQIAREVGYERPNLVSMIKSGQTKLPVQKIGLFAKALGVDPAYLFRLTMSEYLPDTWRTMNELNGAVPTSQNEQAILEEIRKLSHGADPKLQTPAQHKALRAFVDSMLK